MLSLEAAARGQSGEENPSAREKGEGQKRMGHAGARCARQMGQPISDARGRRTCGAMRDERRSTTEGLETERLRLFVFFR